MTDAHAASCTAGTGDTWACTPTTSDGTFVTGSGWFGQPGTAAAEDADANAAYVTVSVYKRVEWGSDTRLNSVSGEPDKTHYVTGTADGPGEYYTYVEAYNDGVATSGTLRI